MNVLFLGLWIVLGVEPIQAKVINQNGIDYVCLVPNDAQKLLQLRLDFPIIEKKLQQYEELIALDEAENTRLMNAVTDLSVQLTAQSQVNEILQQTLSAPVPWYKRPSFWAVAGIFIGVGTTVLVYELVPHNHEKLATTTSP
jgi:hypothetical protein